MGLAQVLAPSVSGGAVLVPKTAASLQTGVASLYYLVPTRSRAAATRFLRTGYAPTASIMMQVPT